MAEPSSIRAFVRHYTTKGQPLHVLVNNAGANYLSERLTEEGVPLLTQVNSFSVCVWLCLACHTCFSERISKDVMRLLWASN